jgi:hypothetical protein
MDIEMAKRLINVKPFVRLMQLIVWLMMAILWNRREELLKFV